MGSGGCTDRQQEFQRKASILARACCCVAACRVATGTPPSPPHPPLEPQRGCRPLDLPSIMGSSAVAALVSGGCLERQEWRRDRCDELCPFLKSCLADSTLVDHREGFEGRNTTGDTAFLMACCTGHVECVKLLAEAGCNTAAKNNDGQNALMCAAASGEAAAVRTALAAGWCELEATDTDGSTAFLGACFMGHAECMELLVGAGCNTAAKANQGLNALMFAAASGVAAAVRAALAAKWCELEATHAAGGTAFLCACSTGRVESMELLAEAGCNTAVKNKSGLNALMCAAESGVARAVRAAAAAGWCELEATDAT